MKLHERLAAIMDCHLDCTARMVLVVIADRLDTDDPLRPVWMSAETIADRSGASRRTVITTLQRLASIGVLTESRRQRSAGVASGGSGGVQSQAS